MNSFPLVSVIIPCYNAEKYIEFAIKSIMCQTYKNLEILIVDDCSTDSTWSILERLAAEDSRIILEKNTVNLKIVKTLNKLVERASGKYIARMDADDVSASKRIEKQVEFLEKNIDYGICGTSAWRINEKNRIIGKSYLPFDSDEIILASHYVSVFYHPSVMIRADIYKKNLYREEFLYAEDMDLWQRILKVTKGKNLKEKLLYYRILNNSASSNMKTGSIQKKRTMELSKDCDFSLLRPICSLSFKGMVLWNNVINTERKKYIKLTTWMKLDVLAYLLERVLTKLFFSIIKKEIKIAI